ncbi:MAG: hypothetical protein ABIL09_12975 [Gemmatimonadota bacterium]
MLINVQRGSFEIVQSVVDRRVRPDRFLWGISGSCARHMVPMQYPDSLMGPFWTIEPLMTVTDPEMKLSFTFGWSDDGRHFTLFGVNTEDPLDQARIGAFPRLLKAVATQDCQPDPGIEPWRQRQAQLLQRRLQRAYAMTDNL